MIARQNGFIGLGGRQSNGNASLHRFQSLSDLAWLPSDLTGLFTLATGGTNPVPGDPVGLMLDCSQFGGKTAAQYMAANGITDPTTCPGKHFKQTTAGARPIYARFPKSGKRNLLTNTEFPNGLSGLTQSLVTATTMVGPGGDTVGAIAVPANASVAYVYNTSYTAPASTPHVLSVFVRMDDGLAPSFGSANVSHGSNDFFLNVGGNTAISPLTYVVEDLGGGLYRVSAGALSNTVNLAHFGVGKYSSNTARGFKVTGYQVTLGTTPTPYQRVTNAYDVTEAGQPDCYCLVGDGLSKCMVTDAVNPGTDKVTVVVGVRKLSDAALSAIIETSVSSSTNNGALCIFGPTNTGNADYTFRSKGTLTADVNKNGFAAPITNVLTGIGDIAADTAILRANGAQVATNAADQGTGNYGNHQLFLMARNQASLFFNGWFTGASIKWNHHSDADRDFIEKFIAKNTPQVTL